MGEPKLELARIRHLLFVARLVQGPRHSRVILRHVAILPFGLPVLEIVRLLLNILALQENLYIRWRLKAGALLIESLI